ncbi:hypothetical protein HYU19_01050 [Candidatus Woesearchaeota archaeon]|nr:hypothetical protein [Candidatus Woesearchaeota archaeon]
MSSNADDRALSVDDLVSAFTSKPLEVQLRRDQDAGNSFSGTGYLLSVEGGLKQAAFRANIDDGVIRFSMDGILLGTDKSAVSDGQDALFLTYKLDRGIQFLGVSFESHAVGLHHLLGRPSAQQGLLSPPASSALPAAEPAAEAKTINAEAETAKKTEESLLELAVSGYQAEFNHRLLGHAISGGLVRGNMVAAGLHPRHYEDLVSQSDAASSLLWDEEAIDRAYHLLPPELLHRDNQDKKAGKRADTAERACIHPMTLAFLAHPDMVKHGGFQDYAYQLIEKSLQPTANDFPVLRTESAIARLVNGFLKAVDEEAQRKELLRTLGYLDEDDVRSRLVNAHTGTDGYQALGHLQPHATLGMVHQDLVDSWITAYQATKDVEQARAALPTRLPEPTPAQEVPLHRPFEVILGGAAEQSAVHPSAAQSPPAPLPGHPDLEGIDLEKILAAEDGAIVPEVVGRVPPHALPISQPQQRPAPYDPERVVSQMWVVYRALQEIGAPSVTGGNSDTVEEERNDDAWKDDYAVARSLIFDENTPTPVENRGRAAYYKVGDFTDAHFKELKRTVGVRKGFTARDILTDPNVKAWDADSVLSKKDMMVMLGMGQGAMKRMIAAAGVKPVNNNPHLKLYRVGDVHEALGLPGWLAEEREASVQDSPAELVLPRLDEVPPVEEVLYRAEAPPPAAAISPTPALPTIDTLVGGSDAAGSIDSHPLQDPPPQEARASEVTLWWVAYQLGQD